MRHGGQRRAALDSTRCLHRTCALYAAHAAVGMDTLVFSQRPRPRHARPMPPKSVAQMNTPPNGPAPSAAVTTDEVVATTPLTTRGLRTPTAPGRPTDESPQFPARTRTVRGAITGLISGLLGLAPHVLHHIAFLAGTALVAGSGGTALFGGLGFVASVPLLLRMRRRFGSWRAPAIAFTVLAATFAFSAFVIGPAISGTPARSTVPAVDHNSHH